MRYAVFDVETAPLSDEQIRQFMPKFEAPGNYKDTEKVAAYIADKEKEWLGRAALSALTGKVLAIGVKYHDGSIDIIGANPGHDDEAHILTWFWRYFTHTTMASYWIGHNIIGFDLPFLCRRSMLLGVKVPRSIIYGRYFDNRFKDTMDAWSFGNREDRISLDNLAKALGVGSKSGSGADFARLWATDKPEAIAYLEHDLNLTMKCAERMGMIE